MMCLTSLPKPYAPLPEYPPDYKSEQSQVPAWMVNQVIAERQRRRLLAGKTQKTPSQLEQPSTGSQQLGGR